MGKKQIPAPPTKFRVGERFILNMGRHTGWASWDGRHGVVVGPPEYRDEWECGSIDGSRAPGTDDGGWRYLVMVPGRPLQHFCEEHMRKPRRERASTWEKFEKATGLRLQRGHFRAVRTPAPKTRASGESVNG
jgi:hypothetical protein